MAVEILTKEDLQEFKIELIEEIKVLIKESSHRNEAVMWLRSKQVRQLLQVSPGTLQNLRIQGKIGFTKIGHLIYYNRHDIDALITGK